MRPTRFALALLGTLAGGASPATAHKPLFIEPGPPAPLIADGTVSYALYGRLDRAGDRRAVRVRLRRGETLVVELLLPDRSPERTTPRSRRPRLSIRGPGIDRAPPSGLAVAFDEATTGTRYIRIAAARARSPGGQYRLSVTGAVRSRFVVVVGEREQFGAADLARLPAWIARVRGWYRAP